jgi:predicted O-methyltransferase YrrM
MRNFFLNHIRFFEILIFPLTFFFGLYRRVFTFIPPERLKLSYDFFTKQNWLPIRFHYFQPTIKKDMLPENYDNIEDTLIGVDLKIDDQLLLLSKFSYNKELEEIPLEKKGPYEPYYRNHHFRSGDAEILYGMIRYYKPKKIIEIGSGDSTLFMLAAIKQNNKESGNSTKLICIEPFERPWLEELGVTVIRKPVELLDLDFFKQLSMNDILFIDSSHIVRTKGDVVFEYLSIIPSLKKGVIVHCHDIYLPRDYPLKYILECKYFWNEQYLFQALIANASKFKPLLALKFLSCHYSQYLEKCCPIFKREKEKEGPASFWFQIIR